MAVIRRATSSCSYGSEGSTDTKSCGSSPCPPLPIFKPKCKTTRNSAQPNPSTTSLLPSDSTFSLVHISCLSLLHLHNNNTEQPTPQNQLKFCTGSTPHGCVPTRNPEHEDATTSGGKREDAKDDEGATRFSIKSTVKKRAFQIVWVCLFVSAGGPVECEAIVRMILHLSLSDASPFTEAGRHAIGNRLVSVPTSTDPQLLDSISGGTNPRNLKTAAAGSGASINGILVNLTSLKSLNISGCSNLTSLLKELYNFIFLNLSGCSNLTSLSKELDNPTSCNQLDISGCSNLASLPKDANNLIYFIKLGTSGCSILTLLLN
uniref:Uncharacterized protein n=1 Tax=Physcomitrium patens TaxID=3218 RepID=A0A7I4FBQ7_PHYPA